VAVPVYAKIVFDLEVVAEAEAQVDLNFRAGIRKSASAKFGINYVRSRRPVIYWTRNLTLDPTDIVEPSVALNGEMSLTLTLEPSVSFLVYGLAGAKASIAPSGGIVFETQFWPDATIVGSFEADISVNLEPDGPALDWLDPKPSLTLTFWEDQWHLFPKLEELVFTRHPKSGVLPLGRSVQLSCGVNRSGGINYQWYHNDLPIPNASNRYLNIINATTYHSGNYHVHIESLGEILDSDKATITVSAEATDDTPAGFFPCPAGEFTMGSPPGEYGRFPEEVQHQVTLTRSFYIQQTEVTNGQLMGILNWAMERDLITVETDKYNDKTVRSVEGEQQPLYTFGYLDRGPIKYADGLFTVEAGKENHAAGCVTWYGGMAFCNFMSRMQGITPAVNLDDWTQDPDLPGYRLPTEAEWEYACRAGSTTAFCSGNLLYNNAWTEPVDPNLDKVGWYFANTKGDGSIGIIQQVAQKEPNDWGLYDMHGNVLDMCWDWDDNYPPGSATDPTGPATGYNKIFRGGSADTNAQWCRSAHRKLHKGFKPEYGNEDMGFRPVSTAVP
jgi:formylglycine-generating enzyme required for sulfatase activity